MFDFIITFQDWILSWWEPIQLMFIYDPISGSYYEWQMSVALQFIAYLLWIGVFVFVIMFVIGFIVNVFYFLKKAIG